MANINFALTALGAVATADNYAVGYPPESAIDGSDTTYHVPTGNTAHWLAVDLGAPKYITSMRLLLGAHGSYSVPTVQYCDDGINWLQSGLVLDKVGDDTYTFDGIIARYWRFSHNRYTGLGANIHAWELIGPTAGPPPVNAPACDEIQQFLDGLEAYWVPCVQNWLDAN